VKEKTSDRTKTVEEKGGGGKELRESGGCRVGTGEGEHERRSVRKGEGGGGM